MKKPFCKKLERAIITEREGEKTKKVTDAILSNLLPFTYPTLVTKH
jgi:hypothetical protein